MAKASSGAGVAAIDSAASVADKNQGFSGVKKGIDAYASESWLMGFLSGLAIALDNDFLMGADVPSLYLWVDNYCKEHPLESTTDAGMQLAFQLIKRK